MNFDQYRFEQNPFINEVEAYEKNLEVLQKAFLAGSEVDPGSMVGSESGRPESLEAQFISLTHEEEDCKLWQLLVKEKVKSPVIQYARRLDLAQAVTYSEGGDVDNLPDRFDRQWDYVKFIGVKGEVSGVAKETEFIVDAMTEETQNKIKSLIRGIDLLCWHGDSTIIDTEFDSFYNQVMRKAKAPQIQVLDKRGYRLSYNDLIDSNTILTKNYARRSGRKLITAVEALDGLVKDEIANRTYFTNADKQSINMKRVLEEGFSTGTGMGTIHYDLFASPKTPLFTVGGAPIVNQEITAFVSNHPKAPNAPATLTPSVIASTTDYEMEAGTYNYAVTAINRFGESVAVETTVVVSGGGKMVQFGAFSESGTPVAGQEALGFRLYRRKGSETEFSDYKLVKTVGLDDTKHYDDNEDIPGTTYAILADWDPKQVVRIAQQMPLYRLPYGVRKDAFEFLIKVYLTLQVKNANKIRIIKNIGDIPNVYA